jgi:hypothetical protein
VHCRWKPAREQKTKEGEEEEEEKRKEDEDKAVNWKRLV